MAIFKKLLGWILFTLTYILLFLQIFVTSQIDEEYDKRGFNYLYNFKLLFYASLFMVVICHFQSSFTNPGKLTHNNNIRYLEFYCATRSMAVKNAENWNTKNQHLIKHTKLDEEDEDLLESDCDYDDTEYEESPVFTEEKLNGINTQFGYNFKKCPACNVGRMPNVNHCLYCEG